MLEDQKIDMAGAVMGTVIAETKTFDDQLILLKTELNFENDGIDGSVLILPDSGSLKTLFEAPGNYLKYSLTEQNQV